MEDIVAKVLKRDISMCQNVIAALKAAAQSGIDPKLPAWIIVMQEVVLITRLEFGLPEDKNFLDLDPEAAEFALSLYNDFTGSLAKFYKQYPNLLPLRSVLVCNAAPYVEMMERRVEEIEKIVLTENVEGGLSWAVFDLNGHPLKVMHVDSFTDYKDEYINVSYDLSSGGVGYYRKLRMQSTASPLAEMKRNLGAGMRKLFLEEGRDGFTKDVVESVNELQAHAPPAPKNLRYGPPVRGTRGRIRKW
jgi:hypothetical protein